MESFRIKESSGSKEEQTAKTQKQYIRLRNNPKASLESILFVDKRYSSNEMNQYFQITETDVIYIPSSRSIFLGKKGLVEFMVSDI